MEERGDAETELRDKDEEPGPGPGGQGEGERRRGPVSFTFTRTSSRKTTTTAAAPRLRDLEPETRDTDSPTQALAGLERGKMLGVRGSERRGGPVVVPLIGRTRWRGPASGPVPGQGAAVMGEGGVADADEAAVVSRAVQELIEDSRRFQDKGRDGAGDVGTRNIPLLMQNHAPPGYEDGDTVNVGLRPEPSTAEEYESVPVEVYGLAMLRGMGWKEGEGIGKTFRQEVKPLVQAIRPKGLGLGAAASLSGAQQGDGVDPLFLGPGSSVLICGGPHRGLRGKIEGLDPDNARAMVRLDLGERVVTISQHALEAVTPSQERVSGKPCVKNEGQRNDGRETGRENDSDHKHKRRRRDAGEESTGSRPPARITWLRTDLLVRMIDRKYRGGAFYNAKLTVEDVVDPTTCVCRTIDGKLLEGIKQSMLETMIPKAQCDPIMVVRGEHSGLLGRVLQRDGDKCVAVVQLDRDDERLLKLDYHSVCQYLGPTGED